MIYISFLSLAIGAFLFGYFYRGHVNEERFAKAKPYMHVEQLTAGQYLRKIKD